MNPYRCEKRAADTLGLILEDRLQFRVAQDGTRSPFNRRWRTVGGHVGWHEALIRYANLFLDAGLIEAVPLARQPRAHEEVWQGVRPTRAGEYLWRTWRDEPFRVVPVATISHLVDKAAEALSFAYVVVSDLLEDTHHRYVEPLRPHAESVVSELLDVRKDREGTWR